MRDWYPTRRAPTGHKAAQSRFPVAVGSAFARAAASQATDAIVAHIVADVDAFADGIEAHDDQTLLLVAIE